MLMPGIGKKQQGGTWRGTRRIALGGGETKQKISLWQGSGWRRMDLGQEELRCLLSDPDVPGLLAGFWLSFLLSFLYLPRRARLVPPVGTPQLALSQICAG